MSFVTEAPFVAVWPGLAIALGVLFAYRSQLIRDRPDVAFMVLTCYGCVIIGITAWLLCELG